MRSSEFDLSREFGVFLGLIELIALTFGGYMTMQEEGVSFGGAADRLSGPGGGWQDQATQQQPPAPAAPAATAATALPAAAGRAGPAAYQPPPAQRTPISSHPPPRTVPAAAPAASASATGRLGAQLAGVASATPAATCLAKAMMVIIGLTWTALGKSEASAT